MNFVTPYEIQRHFPKNPSVAIVGNAPAVLKCEFGSDIDQKDLVIRFNGAKCGAPWAKSVGTRTDLLFSNLYQTLQSSPPPITELHPQFIVCFHTHRDYEVDPTPFLKWAQGIPLFFSLAPDITPTLGQKRSCAYTTGTYALSFVLQWLRPRSLLITGFDFFQGSEHTQAHYWKSGLSPAVHFHDLKVESQTFLHCLRQYSGNLQVSPELEPLLKTKRNRTKKRRPLIQRIAGRLSWALIQLGHWLRQWQANHS